MEYIRQEVNNLGALNAELEKIEVALGDKLGTESTGPRVMHADLDMNGNQILNLSAPAAPTDPVRLQDIPELVGQAQGANFVGETAPASPFSGMRWYKPSEATTFVYYVDGDSGQWVQEPVVSADSTLELQLAAADSTVLVGGVEAQDLALLYSNFRTLGSFGAKGDGVTDDRAAILAANAAGVPVLFEKPAAFYKVNQETIITCPVFIGKYKVFEPSNYIRFDVGAVQEIYPEWWGAKAEYDSTLTQYNSTTAIQSAIRATKTMFSASSINVGVLHAIPVVFGVGVYYTTDLVIEKQCILKGQGRFNTLIKALNNNLDLIRVNTPYPVEIYGISFGIKDGIGPLVGGTIIKIELDSGHNEYTRIVGCSFNNMNYGVFCVDAGFIEIASCYFNANSNAAIVIGNEALPDNGDSQITGCTFNNGTGPSIVQLSGGGLRITNNKFLGGTYNYYGNFSSGNINRTGQLIISDNSFDFCTVANIRLSRTGDTPFSLINILDNIIVTGQSCIGVLVDGFTGETFISDLSIGGNQFYLRNGAVAIHLASLRQATIYPNHYKCDAPENATGIIFAAFPLDKIEIHPQSFYGSITKYLGNQAAASFVVGCPVRGSGTPVNTIGADYIGQEYLDTTNNQWYKSKGLTGTDWILLG